MPVDEVTTLTVPVHVCAENVVSHDYIRSRRFRLSIAGRAVRSGGKMASSAIPSSNCNRCRSLLPSAHMSKHLSGSATRHVMAQVLLMLACLPRPVLTASSRSSSTVRASSHADSSARRA